MKNYKFLSIQIEFKLFSLWLNLTTFGYQILVKPKFDN